MPDFTIIAGPNGAGKSTYSKALSSFDALIFDADIVKAVKEKQFPDLPAESIEMMLSSAYWEAEDMAVEQQRDLVVENNLRNDFLINRLDFFKNKGFGTNLIFLLLPDVETSVDRVALRVAQKGHFVDLESVKYNFEQGLLMLKTHFDKFENLRIVESSLDRNTSFLKTLLLIKNKHIDFIEPNIPFWAKPIINEIIHKVITN